MTDTHCPKCGHQIPAEAAACEKCGQCLANGTVQPLKGPAQKPPPPPELAGYVFEKTPPEMVEEARRAVSEEEVLAALREYQETGGCGMELKDFIHELEQGASPQ